MRAIFVVTMLLTLALPQIASAEPAQSNYSTLLIELVGELDRPVASVVISTSSKQDDSYRQDVDPDVFRFIACVHVVPPPVLNQIAEAPLVKRALESAQPVDAEPKSPGNVTVTAGVGRHHRRIMVDAHPALNSELHGIAKHHQESGLPSPG